MFILASGLERNNFKCRKPAACSACSSKTWKETHLIVAAPMTPHTEALILLFGTLALLAVLTVLNFVRGHRQHQQSKTEQS